MREEKEPARINLDNLIFGLSLHIIASHAITEATKDFNTRTETTITAADGHALVLVEFNLAFPVAGLGTQFAVAGDGRQRSLVQLPKLGRLRHLRREFGQGGSEVQAVDICHPAQFPRDAGIQQVLVIFPHDILLIKIAEIGLEGAQFNFRNHRRRQRDFPGEDL